MGKARKFLIVISGIIIIIIAIISIANSYHRVQVAQQEVIQSDKDVVAACQGVKDAMLNPNLPTAQYQNGLADYNAKCADKTGALK